MSLDDKESDKAFSDEKLTFDCIGCHNRPTHIYYSPDKAVNTMMAANRIPRDLPWVKKVATDALSADYPDRESWLEDHMAWRARNGLKVKEPFTRNRRRKQPDATFDAN